MKKVNAHSVSNANEKTNNLTKNKTLSKPQVSQPSGHLQSKKENHLHCHICSKPLEMCELEVDDVKASKNLPCNKSMSRQNRNCSACLLPTCTDCGSSSVLAKVSQFLFVSSVSAV